VGSMSMGGNLWKKPGCPEGSHAGSGASLVSTQPANASTTNATARRRT
jgi:hypothetical protein